MTTERWDPRTASWLKVEPPKNAAAPRKRKAKDAKPAQTRVAPVGQQRMYHAARRSRLTDGWSSAQTSEDTESYSSLRTLRGHSRSLMRDSAYASRAQVIVVNNVIGAGVGMQAQVRNGQDGLVQSANEGIEAAFELWSQADSCHTGGALHLADLERLLMGEVFEAGEIFVRVHRRRFGGSAVPLALEVIEPERLADDFGQPVASNGDNEIRLGIEVDRFNRPVAYWFRERHPGELRYQIGQTTEQLYRVPAADIFHLRLVKRWPQTRGVPWLHTTARRLNDMDGYSEAEIVAARASACQMGFIESEDGSRTAVDQQTDPNGQPTITMEAGTVEYLNPGEKFTPFTPTRPNTGLDPFLRYMLREVAAGIGVSYESLSRDYSQSNYSSSRLSLLDDRDLWRMLQQWWIRSFRAPLHRLWLESAVMAGAIEGLSFQAYNNRPNHYAKVRFKPRGWTWIDPAKEVEAFKEARKAGFISTGDIIAQTANGKDAEQVWNEIRDEDQMQSALGLTFDTDKEVFMPKEPAAPAPAARPAAVDEDDEDDDEPQRAARPSVVSLTR